MNQMPRQPQSVHDLFPSRYISEPDLKGQDVVVQIDRICVETMEDKDGNSKEKGVVYFRGHSRGLVLNQVNGLTIAGMLGEELSHWPGNWIVLYPTTCQAFGKTQPCIRVRPFPPQHGNAQPAFSKQAPQQPFGPAQPFAPQQQGPGNAPAVFAQPPAQQPLPQQQSPPFPQQPQQQPGGNSPIQF